jgi:hypothetical protein
LLAGEPEFCVAGTVLNAVTGEPLRRAAVTIPQSATLTDAAGVFRFCGLPAGSYHANAEKPGFVAGGYPVTVGPSREDLLLRLHPLSTVSGKVLDDAGEPLQNALIQLLSMEVAEGRRRVRVASAMATDDRGEYRLAGLSAGRYYLRAAGWDGEARDRDTDEAFAPMYYGGATDLASAAPVTIEVGRDLRADFAVSLKAAYRIRGALAGLSTGVPAKMELLGGDGEPSGDPVKLDTATGAFQIDGVVPGSYIVRATEGEGRQRRRGELAVQVSAAVNGLVVPLAAAAVLRGVVRMASSPNCAVKVSPAEAWIAGEAALETETDAKGEFQIESVLPGRYRLRMDCAAGYISAARMGDADLLASGEFTISPGANPPIEMAMGSNGATLDMALPAEGAGREWVVLLPTSGNELQTRFGYLKGKLTFTAVAPGDYQLFAWSGSAEAFEYANAEARQAWAGRAVSVHIGEHDRQSITLKSEAEETQ